MVNRSDDSSPTRGAATTVARCAAMLLAATLVGCSGAADTGAGTTLPLPTSVPVAETTQASLPAASAPTASLTSTPPTAVAAAPSSSPSTSTDRPALSEDQAKRDVIEAAIDSWTAFNNVLLDPGNDDLLRALALTRTGDALDRAIEGVIGYRARNEAERTHPNHPAEITVREDSVSVDLASGTATLEYCRVGSNIWVEVGANPDGSDRVLNDEINSYIEMAVFELVGDVWLRTRATEISKYKGELTCLID